MGALHVFNARFCVFFHGFLSLLTHKNLKEKQAKGQISTYPNLAQTWIYTNARKRGCVKATGRTVLTWGQWSPRRGMGVRLCPAAGLVCMLGHSSTQLWWSSLHRAHPWKLHFTHKHWPQRNPSKQCSTLLSSLTEANDNSEIWGAIMASFL